MKRRTTWIVIADGAQARVVETTGPGSGLSEVSGMDFADERLRERDILADRQGRSFDSHGVGRHAMENPSDPVRQREAAFAAHVVAELDRRRRERAFDRLVVIAAPRTLGDMRAAMTAPLREVVAAELDKDLTNVPRDRLADHLKEVVTL